MRVVGWFGLAALVGMSLGSVAIGSALAQGSSSDPVGRSATVSRREGTVAPPVSGVATARANLRLAWARYRPLSWAASGTQWFSDPWPEPVWLPRKRAGQ